ncbi:MAG: phenylacetate-CoA oxygenase subunit PaaA [Phycisphaerae bacterium]|nr:MAG: 1,2-phenylacetyl-CoA epoxidase subunit A [Planctomycetia bacterium]RIK71582.1 MAG: 1,2-phenylacetyl-CoA epoxidase subunit A [Planctomycetota bacterium]GJQ25809.1 MAG: phenylacetate-CoA oxygenase subunit PaaA [Phycisphaerae bacterium]
MVKLADHAAGWGDKPGDPGYEDRLAKFEARVARGDKVEPGDWMPNEYRQQLIRLIHVHANSEICGALPEGTWIPHAPTFKRKLALCAKVQDEVGHGQLLYRAAETLGKPREEMIDELISGKAKYSNVFHYPAETWADVCVIAWLIDAAAIVNQKMMADGSYGPYGRALRRICYEEAFHLTHGYDMCISMATGTKLQREMLQDAVNRWWKPIMMFHGPSDKESTHTALLMKWKIKLKTNDEQRQEFLRKYLPKMFNLGLTVPAEWELRFDEKRRTWLYNEPDWEEFKTVVRGGGPVSAQRLETRRLSHEHGRWVREALAAAAAGKRAPLPPTAVGTA